MRKKEFGPYISVAEVAELVCVDVSTLYRWKKTDIDFPKPIQLSYRAIIYRTEEVINWIEGKASKEA